MSLAASSLMLLLSRPAGAADFTLLTTGAFKQAALALVAGFEAGSGDHVTIEADTAGGVLRRIKSGHGADVVIVTPAVIDGLITDGALVPGSRRDVAQVGIGVAVRAGGPRPDLSSAERFRAALLAAPAVAIVDPASGGSSGIYLTALFVRLGIADAMAIKLVRVNAGLAASAVADGRASMALQQVSELLTTPGVEFVGPLPDSVQNVTVYSAGLSAHAAEGSDRLLSALTGPTAAAVVRSKGMSSPPSSGRGPG